MLFPRVDTRAQLLAAGYIRGARVAEYLEIDMSSALSQRAVVLINRGQSAMRMMRHDTARVHYCDAATAAREDSDGFAEAAAMLLLTELLDGITGHPDAQRNSCAEAAALIEYDIFRLREKLMQERTPRAEAVKIMEPRLDLEEIIAYNRCQYDVRSQSLEIVDARKRTEALLINRDGDSALRYAEAGKANSARTFGRDHWWCGIFEARRVMALIIRDGRSTEESRKGAVAALNLLEEWTQDGDQTFKVDVEMMSQAEAGTLMIL